MSGEVWSGIVLLSKPFGKVPAGVPLAAELEQVEVASRKLGWLQDSDSHVQTYAKEVLRHTVDSG